MNTRFDALARYSWYGELTDQQIKVINKELDSKAINYIIDYSIAPGFFMDFIGLENFNIYSIGDYRLIYDEYQYMLSKELTISLVNRFLEKKINIDVLHQALSSDYYLEEINFYLDNYETGIDLITNPKDYLLEFTEQNTLGNYRPKSLVLVEGIPQTNPDVEIYLELQALESLKVMCKALEENFKAPCGGLELKAGYLSYEELTAIQNDYDESYYGSERLLYQPGSSYFQLGVVVLFLPADDSEEWLNESVLQWLWENAHYYKFSSPIPPGTDGCVVGAGYPYYYRYIGTEQYWKEQDTGEGSNVCGV
jgi:D-alanyl-D-alanine carboxypeptidase